MPISCEVDRSFTSNSDYRELALKSQPQNMASNNDLLDKDSPDGPEYLWFQYPAPSFRCTFGVWVVMAVWTMIRFTQRIRRSKEKFGEAKFKGSLRFCAQISAYMDNDDPTFAVLRLATKSLFFLGLLQIDYNKGFLIMLVILSCECGLDFVRILLAFWNCRSLRQLQATSIDEVQQIRAATQLEPTNVYEDITRPLALSLMVFTVQSLLIAIVLWDAYTTNLRTCFDGTGTNLCPMLASTGSYCLYILGTFMACVFYVGPLNSYGKKEHDPVFWLKLFLMAKQSRSVISWTDAATEQVQMMNLRRNDLRIWLRCFMSFYVNSMCFHFLLHVLPIQIASKAAIISVVFSSVGMIYLVDLDDTSGATMTLLSQPGERVRNDPEDGSASTAGVIFESVKQKLLEDAMREIRAKLQEALKNDDDDAPHHVRVGSITHALLLSSECNTGSTASANADITETSPLVTKL